MQIVEQLKYGGGTNIYSAIEKGIDLVVSRQDKSRNP